MQPKNVREWKRSLTGKSIRPIVKTEGIVSVRVNEKKLCKTNSEYGDKLGPTADAGGRHKPENI